MVMQRLCGNGSPLRYEGSVSLVWVAMLFMSFGCSGSGARSRGDGRVDAAVGQDGAVREDAALDSGGEDAGRRDAGMDATVDRDAGDGAVEFDGAADGSVADADTSPHTVTRYFAPWHPFNTPIGDGAQYGPTDLEPIQMFNMDEVYAVEETPSGRAVTVARPCEPSFGPNTNRCCDGETVTPCPGWPQVHLPDSFLIPDVGQNNIGVIIDGEVGKDFGAAARCAGDLAYLFEGCGGSGSWWFVNMFSTSVHGHHGGTYLNSTAGLLTVDDIQPEGRIQHALQIEFKHWQWYVEPDGSQRYDGTVIQSRRGFPKWPAEKSDAIATTTSPDPSKPWESQKPAGYRNPYSYMREGVRLAIPRDVDLDGLGFQTQVGLKLARAFQEFGGIGVDSSGSSRTLRYTIGAQVEVRDEFAGLYGHPFAWDYWDHPQAGTHFAGWIHDIRLIYEHLRAVTNDSAMHPGGPGNRIAAWPALDSPYRHGKLFLAVTQDETEVTRDVNLSQEGSLDWVHLGYDSPSAIVRKAGANLISVTDHGNAQHGRVTGEYMRHSWSDGTPVAQASNSSAAATYSGTSVGVLFSFPAGQTERIVRIRFGTTRPAVRVRAWLSDGSQPENVGFLLWHDSTRARAVAIVRYRAASEGQTLTVELEKQSGGQLVVQSATLALAQ